MPKLILLDTNFLMIPAQFRVDIFSEIRRICDFSYELAVVQATVDELNRIAAGKGREKAAALLALRLIKAKNIRIISSKTASFKNADKVLLDVAAKKRDSIVVATQDMALKAGLKKLGTSVIVLRQKKYLSLG